MAGLCGAASVGGGLRNKPSTSLVNQLSAIIKENVMSLAYKTVSSPVGELKLVASDKGLVAILWENDKPNRVPLRELEENDRHPILLKTEQQLNEYFAGKRKSFSIALDMCGTRFQNDVWNALLAIPFGET